MPFNKELEDFAQAFSTGYGMVKSKEEREAEQLDLQHKRFLTERDPITASQQDESHAIEMERARGEISDAEAARKQNELLYPLQVREATSRATVGEQAVEAGQHAVERRGVLEPLEDRTAAAQATGAEQTVEAGAHAVERRPELERQQDIEHGLRADVLEGQLADAKVARDRLPIEWKQKDEAAATLLAKAKEELDTAQQLNTPAMKDARQKVAAAEVATVEANARVATEGATPEALAQKREAIQSEIDAHKAAMAASQGQLAESGARVGEIEVDTEIKKLQLKKDKAKDALLDGLRDRFKKRSANKPAINQPRAVDIGPPGGLSIDGEPGVLGPAVPVPPNSPAGSESNLGMFNPPGLEGPAEAAPAEVTTDSNALAPVPPLAPTQAVDDTGVVSLTGQEAPAALSDDRQQAIDYFRNGSGNTLPNGKKVIDVAGKHAVIDGLNGMAEQHGLNGDSAAVDTPETDEQARGFLTGASAASPSTVAMMEQTVQEQSGEEEMSQNELTYNTLATGWLFNNAMGEPEEAKKYAQALMSHYQMVFGQYVAMAHASAEAGDHEHTATALERAYANVPTNDELTIRPTKDGKHYIAKIIDVNGKVTEQQLMTPEEMGAYALDIDASSFVPLISQAAGRESKTLSPAAAKLIAKQLNISEEEAAGLTTEEVTRLQAGEKQGKSSFADRDAASKAIGDAIDTFKEEHSEQAKKLHFDDPKLSPLEDIRPITKRIILDNDIDSERALRAVVNIIADGPGGKPEELSNGNLRIHMRGFNPFEISVDDYTVLTANRNKQRGSATEPRAPSAGWKRISEMGSESEGAVPVAAPPGSGASTRFSRVPVRPPTYGPPPPVRPGTNPPQSGARTRF